MSREPRVWVLADDRPGNRNQSFGVAEALGWPVHIKTVRYGALARLPNALLGASLWGLTPAVRGALGPPWPAVALGAGRRAAPVLRWIKRHSPATLVVQLMWPGAADGLDLIVVPEHDRVPAGGNVLRTQGAPHGVTPARLRAAAARLADRLADLPRPRIACLVGGSSRRQRFTPQHAECLARQASALARARSGSLLVTTSRRTGEPCGAALAAALDVPHLLHRWHAGDDHSPYLGILGSADALIVTADSASMCTEACAAGRPVFLAAPGAPPPAKLRRLHERLAVLGHLRPLGAPWPERVPPPLNPARMVAEAISIRLGHAARGDECGRPLGEAVATAAMTP